MASSIDVPLQEVMQAAKTLVIKLGSALVTNTETGAADTAFLARLAAGVESLKTQGVAVIIVSSGAIALGRSVLGEGRPTKLEQKQAAAAIGQVRLMQAFGDAFSPLGVTLAQNLITLEDTEMRRRWLNARDTLETLLDLGVVPIINENDTIATDEIRFGDNDRLAARVAAMMGADILFLLSDIDGLYTGDPRTDEEAQHVPYLGALGPDILSMAGHATSEVSSGGMHTKILAAEIAFQAGCATVICDGSRPFPFIEPQTKHTLIQPDITVSAARRVWLEGHLTPSGKLYIDAGAVAALHDGASLLPVGVTGFAGDFSRGDAVGIYTSDDTLIAKGIVNYAADHVRQIAGRRTKDLVADKTADFTRSTLVHRDDLVLLNT